MQEITVKAANMAKESTLGRMALNTQDSGMRIKSMEKVFTAGSMADVTMGSGWTITCMARVCTLGRMDAVTRENMSRIESMDMVYTSGQTAESTKAIGKMEGNTVKDSIGSTKTRSQERGPGMKASVRLGLMTTKLSEIRTNHEPSKFWSHLTAKSYKQPFACLIFQNFNLPSNQIKYTKGVHFRKDNTTKQWSLGY